MERGISEDNNKPKRATFTYEKEGQFCIGIAKVEIKEDGTITVKRFLVFNYTGKNIVTIYAYKK